MGAAAGQRDAANGDAEEEKVVERDVFCLPTLFVHRFPFHGGLRLE